VYAPFFHVGLVVPDIEGAMTAFGGALGLTWARVEQRPTPVQTRAGRAAPDLRFTYSRQGPPHIELVEAVEVEPWQLPAAGALHHVGLWVDDLDAAVAALEREGSPVVASGRSRSGALFGFTYHEGPSGTLLELVDARSKPAFGRWIDGGRYA